MQPLYFTGMVENLSLDPFINVFLSMLVLDLITGMAKAVKRKVANSTIGLNGLIRHAIIVFIVLMGAVYMPIFGLEVYVPYFVGYFILQYVISVIENLGVIGVPLPKSLKEIIYKLNDTVDNSLGDKLMKVDKIVFKDDKVNIEIKKDVDLNG